MQVASSKSCQPLWYACLVQSIVQDIQAAMMQLGCSCTAANFVEQASLLWACSGGTQPRDGSPLSPASANQQGPVGRCSMCACTEELSTVRGAAHTCAQCLKMRWAGERKGLSRATIRRAVRLFGNSLQSHDFVQRALALHQAELSGAELPPGADGSSPSHAVHSAGQEPFAPPAAARPAHRHSRPSAGRRATMRGLPMSPHDVSGCEPSGIDQSTESESEDSGHVQQCEPINPLDAFAGTVLAAAMGEEELDLSPTGRRQYAWPASKRGSAPPRMGRHVPEHMAQRSDGHQDAGATLGTESSMHRGQSLQLSRKRSLGFDYAAFSEVWPQPSPELQSARTCNAVERRACFIACACFAGDKLQLQFA